MINTIIFLFFFVDRRIDKTIIIKAHTYKSERAGTRTSIMTFSLIILTFLSVNLKFKNFILLIYFSIIKKK
jgi:hypothetical protein